MVLNYQFKFKAKAKFSKILSPYCPLFKRVPLRWSSSKCWIVRLQASFILSPYSRPDILKCEL